MEHFLKKLQFSKREITLFQRKIQLLDEFKGYWKGNLNISPQILHRLKKFNLITSTGASTRIEGSYLSDDDVRKLLKGLTIKKMRDRSEQEVAGYAKLTQLIFDHYPKIKWSESEIKNLHKILLEYSEKDIYHRGEYKKGSNAVVARDQSGQESIIFNPTPPYLTEKEMRELLQFTAEELKNKKIHPLLIIGHFVCEFLSIHPFQDGNGRLSRALNNLLLLREGYSYAQYVSLEKIIEERKESYYLALRTSQMGREKGQNNIASWMHFFLDTLIEQKNRAKLILSRRNIEEELSDKQIMILRLFQSNDEALSVREIVKLTSLGRNTVRKILERLRELGIIRSIGLGRTSRWVRIPHL